MSLTLNLKLNFNMTPLRCNDGDPDPEKDNESPMESKMDMEQGEVDLNVNVDDVGQIPMKTVEIGHTVPIPIRISSMKGNAIYERYTFGKGLGKGGSAKVFEVLDKRDGHRKACKVLLRCKQTKDGRVSRSNEDKVQREISILTQLSHPNIVRCFDCLHDDKYMFIVMELLNGGELFKALRNHGRFNERLTLQIMKPLFSALAYIHQNKIMHRDIKLENILLREFPRAEIDSRCEVEPEKVKVDNIDSNDVVLVDFGLARVLKDKDDRSTTFCGSTYYVAPEVLDGNGYAKQADLWSSGVILFMLLTDTPPFYDTKETSTLQAISAGEFSMDHIAFKSVSAEMKHLLKRCLTLHPLHRITADEALTHPVFASHGNDVASKDTMKPRSDKARVSRTLAFSQLGNLARLRNYN